MAYHVNEHEKPAIRTLLTKAEFVRTLTYPNPVKDSKLKPGNYFTI